MLRKTHFFVVLTMRLKKKNLVIPPWHPSIFFLKTLCMESTHNGFVFSWDSLRSLCSLFRVQSVFLWKRDDSSGGIKKTLLGLKKKKRFWVVHPCFHLSVLLSYSCNTVSQRSLGGELFQIWTRSRTYDDVFAHIWLLGWSVLFLYIHIHTHAHIFWTESRTKGCDVRIFSAADGPKPHCHRMWSYFATIFCIWL